MCTKTKFLFFLFICFFNALTLSAREPNFGGGYISYEWISGNLAKIFVHFSLACPIDEIPDSIDFYAFNACSNTPRHEKLAVQIRPVGAPLIINPCDFRSFTNCNSGTLTGIRRNFICETIIEQSASCRDSMFVAAFPKRQHSDNYADGGAELRLVLNERIGNGNNGLFISVNDAQYTCTGSPYAFQTGAYSFDADSMSLKFVQTLDNSHGSLSFHPLTFTDVRYNTTNNPLNSNYSCELDGMIFKYTPIRAFNEFLSFEISSYKDSKLMATSTIDYLMITEDCLQLKPAQVNYSDTFDVVRIQDTVYAKVQQPLKFNFSVSQENSLNGLQIATNSVLSLPGSRLLYQNNGGDTAYCNLKWTPTATDTGLKKLIISIQYCTPLSLVPVTEAKEVNFKIGEDFVLPREWMNVYPNPTRGNFKILLFTNWAGAYDIAFYDVTGRQVGTVLQNVQCKEGYNEINMTNDKINLSQGMYYIKCTGKRWRGVAPIFIN